MRHSNPVLQPGFFSAGNGMANFFQKKKTPRILKKSLNISTNDNVEKAGD